METQEYLGIDLGTSNCALAHAGESDGEIQVLSITQAVSPDAVADLPTLASALYLPHDGEFAEGSFALPWSDTAPKLSVTGQFAREHGAKVPDRLVTSAKSWLCNPQVDHRSPILPWGSDIGSQKVSPFDASCRYLQHLRDAYCAQGKSLNNTLTVLTVPASFDEAARTLTHEAATQAGLGEVTLLEEPQAAFYAWLDQAGKDWRNQVSPGDLVLVCDVGGGTSDFSLIAISEEAGELALERISVGEHILLGGDNIDLALAYILKQQLEAQGTELDDWQFQSLRHLTRLAKETLFEREELSEAPIAIPSRGSSLFAGTISTQLTRETLNAVVLDGFIPKTEADAQPARKASAGLQEFGLNYATDPALSKHLAAFLQRSHANVKSHPALAEKLQEKLANPTLLIPDAVLFNGGFFKAACARQRVLELLSQWANGQTVRELSGSRYDLAVACGAAAYARIKHTQKGIRIKAGTARSYYLGLESTMMAIPGFTPPVKALCIVPQGMEEGSECVLNEKEFGLVTGSEVNFRFFSSAIRAGDTVGTILPDALKELEESATLQTTLTPPKGQATGETVPVKIHAAVSELGTLEIWMQHTRSEQTWKLEFSVRTE